MLKFIKNILVFTLSFVLFVIIPLILIATRDNADKYTSANNNIYSLQNKSRYDSLDVLFVGNSHGYSSINPKILDSVGIRSYNLSIANAGVEFYELILSDYLSHVNKYPCKIFILVSPTIFSSKTDDFKNYPIHRYLENPLSNFELAMKFNRQNEILAMYRKSISKGFLNIISRTNKNQFTEVFDRGFVKFDLVASEQIVKETEYLYKPYAFEVFEDTKYSALRKILNSLNEKGIEVVFLELPTNILPQYFNRDYLINYEITLDKLGKQAKLIRLDSDLFTSANYRDIDHMNYSGATIATKGIINFLNNTSNNIDYN